MDNTERRNARKCVVGEGLFGTGMGFLSSVSVLPLLLKSLGASAIQIGLVGSIFWAGWLVLQPLGLFLFGRRRRTKRFLVPWSLTFAVPTYLAMGVMVYFLAGTRPQLCVVLLLVILAVRVLGAGMAVPFWLDWQAMLFRREIRGRVIGMMAGAFPLGIAVAAVVASKVVGSVGFPLNYALLCFVSALFFAVASCFTWSVREPESLTEPGPILGTRGLLRLFGRSLREPNFRSYLVARLLMTLGSGGAAFYALLFKSSEGGGLSGSKVIMLSALLALAQCLVSYPLGRLGDRAGHKVGVVLGSLAQVGAVAVAWLGSGAVACGVTFALVGVACASAWVSHVNMLFETCPHDSHAAHITLSNVVLGPVLWLVPVLTGWMVGVVGLRTAIGITLIPTVAGTIWLAVAVKEPRHVEMARVRAEKEAAPASVQDATAS